MNNWKRTSAVLSATIAAFAFMESVPLSAQTEEEPETPMIFHACFVQQSGVVYRVGEVGLRSETPECVSPNHILFSWNRRVYDHRQHDM